MTEFERAIIRSYETVRPHLQTLAQAYIDAAIFLGKRMREILEQHGLKSPAPRRRPSRGYRRHIRRMKAEAGR